jgi:hypothetical protein
MRDFSLGSGSRGFVCVLAVAALASTIAGFAGCSQHDVSRISSDLVPAPEPEAGQLQLALTSRGASGALYRLRQASFEIFSQDQFGSFAGFLQSESDPLATSLETTLDIGNYQIALFSGWFLEKVEGSQVTRVQAQLLSPDTQDFSISPNGETTVRYRFQTNGEIIEFGQGRLIVQIDVDEQASPPPSADAGPGVVLGEPLAIVDGNVGQNPFGINATLFAVAAPVGADITVTNDTDQICVQGSIQPVLNEDFATQWGVAFGLVFLGPGGSAQPWDLAAGDVTGFAFTVSGPDFPFSRFTALPGGADPTLTNFCNPLPPVAGQSVLMPLDSLTRDCWNPGGEPLSTLSLANIGWNVVSDVGVAHTFDFCISDLRPILR